LAAPKTRDRVLESSLELFNARGVSNVTTAEIARTVGINEGNLYYYFQKKEQLVTALFDAFEAEIRVTAAGELTDPKNPAEYIGYLRGWFATAWRYRFVQRDTAALFDMAPGLRERAAVMITDAETASRRVLEKVVDAGLLTIEPEMLEPLLANAWIVSSHWIDYLDMRHRAGELGPAHLDWGFRQVLTLFLPYLSEELRGWLSSPAAPFASISEATV
jgi:AcrR family transcriptional regulator